jgi:NitT/TauT family transport system permease protein
MADPGGVHLVERQDMMASATPDLSREGLVEARSTRLSSLWRRFGAAVVALSWTVASLSGAVLTWWLVHRFGNLSDRILPSPFSVAVEVWERRSLLWSESLVTGRSILLGFGASVAVGTVVGTGLAFSRILSRLVFPLLVVSQAVPKVALAPILIIWFGLGSTTHAVLAFSVAVFPVVVNATLGFQEIDDDYVRLGRSMGAPPWRVFTRIRVPFAVPKLFAGYKVAITLATVGAIVGELLAGNQGLGYLAQAASGNLQTELTFAAIVAMSILGIAVFYLVVLLEAIALRIGHLRPEASRPT